MWLASHEREPPQGGQLSAALSTLADMMASALSLMKVFRRLEPWTRGPVKTCIIFSKFYTNHLIGMMITNGVNESSFLDLELVPL